MFGAIIGDIIGSRFEFSKYRNKSEQFELFTDQCKFTDDTVMTIATADAILNNISFQDAYLKWGNKYPDCGYGSRFKSWLESSKPQPYGSFGNGSAMRVSPVGFLASDLQQVFKKAEETAIITHNHPEGIKGSMAVAACVYLAKNKTPKKIIKEIIETYFDYDLNRKIVDIRPSYIFNETCQGSVPESIICFLEGEDYEDVVRKAISLGGDTDTQACIAGSIADAYYTIPCSLLLKGIKYLPRDMMEILNQFSNNLPR